MRSPGTAVLPALVLVACAPLASGCAVGRGGRAPRAAAVGPLLAAAGFQTVPSDTPARLERLAELPALRLTASTRGDQVHYWCADPAGCRCLYTGGEAQYASLASSLAVRGGAWRADGLGEEEAATLDDEMDYWLPPGATRWPAGPGAAPTGPTSSEP